MAKPKTKPDLSWLKPYEPYIADRFFNRSVEEILSQQIDSRLRPAARCFQISVEVQVALLTKLKHAGLLKAIRSKGKHL